VFWSKKTAVFVDGCFWHGCRRHRKVPTTNRLFWAAKIERNRRRDRAVSQALRREGWKVLRFWEHDLRKNPKGVLAKVVRELSERNT